MDAVFDLSDNVVLVTGGRSGIGRAVVEGFLAAGSTVISMDVSNAPVAPSHIAACRE